ncbi:MAG: cytochrome c3 family protein, partial [Desulfuromonadales bacterium]|nr:cytochrome c3 family protein [Desulfuromonadales bacterium]
KPAVEGVAQKVDETVSAVKSGIVEQVEVAKGQAADVVDQTSSIVAAGVDATGPDLVNYDASQGMVIFNHTEHSSRLACSDCHTTDPPQKIVINKETAHDLCRGCHKGVSNAPKSCSGCHIK